MTSVWRVLFGTIGVAAMAIGCGTSGSPETSIDDIGGGGAGNHTGGGGGAGNGGSAANAGVGGGDSGNGGGGGSGGIDGGGGDGNAGIGGGGGDVDGADVEDFDADASDVDGDVDGVGGTSGVGGAGGTGGTVADGGPGGSMGGTDSGGTGGGPAGGGTGGSGGVLAPISIVTCQGKVYQCGNGKDDDGDGLIDMNDPDCLGPCHNNESGYFLDIPGGGMSSNCALDCYFDQDSGSGNDDCYWSHKCDPLETAANGWHPQGPTCAYDPKAKVPGSSRTCEQLYLSQSKQCESFCAPLVPNGCDCFGCCELPAGSGKFVWLGSVDNDGKGTCDRHNLDDPNKCRPCTPVKGACYKPCEHCMLCLGKTELPEDCLTDPGTGGAGGSAGGGGAGGGASGGGGSGGAAGGGGGSAGGGAGGSGAGGSGAGGSGGGGAGGAGGTGAGGGGTSGGGGAGPECGRQFCPGDTQACSPYCACPAGQYCLTGCCAKAPK